LPYESIEAFRKDLLIERTHAGLARARAQEVKLGRKRSLSKKSKPEVLSLLSSGMSVARLVKDFSATRQTIMRIREKNIYSQALNQEGGHFEKS
jgi:putative DNA-invertase from lambdoid prophage Rac